MKLLALLRHAKSSWGDPNLADFDRPLNARGIKAATRIGAEMRRLDLSFDLVIASPATRVRETLSNLEDGYGATFNVRFEPRIYEASSHSLLGIIRDVDDADRLLLVGHNPGFQQLASAITSSGDPLHAKVANAYPTAALLVTELPARSWREIEPGTGRILSFLKPRELT